MGLDRRTFLQRAILALFSLGVSETGISVLAKDDRFAPWLQAYGQNNHRKLALLIGINQYSGNNDLKGCLTDVELQRELLIHKFGFLSQDIVTLTDRQATRENIETAFVEHLTEQAKTDDVVIFHFSGYGSRVKVPTQKNNKNLAPDSQILASLVPADNSIPNKGNPAPNDLFLETLFDLVRSLKTKKVTTILDAGFQETQQTLQGNFRIRSYPDQTHNPNPEETAFREQIRIKLKSAGIKNNRLPGIILNATQEGLTALEGQWHNFNAGLFTYALTQYLWQTVPNTKTQYIWQNTLGNMALASDNQQQPQIKTENKINGLYVIAESNVVAGEGFIDRVDNKNSINLKLTGIPLSLLDDYGLESCFTVANSQDKIQLQLRSQDGINGKAQIIGNSTSPNGLLQPGQIIQESIRVLPKTQGLIIALDKSLERIERVDATSALANSDLVTNTVTVGEHNADYILSKVAKKDSAIADPQTTSIEKIASYGLLTPGGTLIPNTLGVANEIIKLAVSRLKPEFRSLLASKWLQLIINDYASLIPLEATLTLSQKTNSNKLKSSTRNAPLPPKSDSLKLETLPTIPQDAPLQLTLTNSSESILYSILVEVTPTGQITTLYKPETEATETEKITPINWEIPGKSKLVIPEDDSLWQWNTPESKGINQLYVIVATQPFTKTLALLSQEATIKRDRSQILNLLKPLEVTQAILEDLHSASAVSSDIISSNSDVYALDNNAWTTFHFIYEIV